MLKKYRYDSWLRM